jgi:hypothetical protein
MGLWLTLDAGTFDGVAVNSQSGAVRAGFSGATQFKPQVRLRVEQPAKVTGVGTYRPATALKSERGTYVVPSRMERLGWNSSASPRTGWTVETQAFAANSTSAGMALE